MWIGLVAGCGRVGFDLSGGTGGDGNPGGDGGGGGGDGAIDGPNVDALISPGCGTTAILVDDFADGTIDPQWTAVNTGGYTIGETGGTMRVTFPASAPVNTRGGYREAATIVASMTGGCHYIETVWGRGYVLKDPDSVEQDLDSVAESAFA